MNKAESLAVQIMRLTERENYSLTITQTGAWIRLGLSSEGYEQEADYINIDILTALERFLSSLSAPSEKPYDHS